ncbi:MAG: ROK family transcriptional regulator [Propionibacteriaceae bacterium]|jgi:predicted NBD/HSP70 family sugar kinase|nr:ROK family transcriptional regulator [Propionibacteriaceae bacterium]
MTSTIPPTLELATPNPELRRAATGPAIINLLREHDGISRTELAKRLGVSNQAVSKTVIRLMGDGLVRETGRQSIGVGKARTKLSLVPRSRYALGMHLDRSSFVVSLVNLTGEVEGSISSSFETVPSPEDAVETLRAASAELLGISPKTKKRLVGGGLGMAGPVDHTRGIATAPHNFSGWHNVPLALLLSDAIGTPILIDNEANMAMAAEHWRSGRAGWTVVMYVGTGLRAAMMLDGDVYHGSHSNAGEVGHMVVDPAGPLCVCGRRGCVEVFSSPAAAVERYFAKTGKAQPCKNSMGPTWSKDTLGQLTELSSHAKRGESAAREALRESGAYLGIAAANLATLLDIDQIVLAGPMLSLLGADFVAGAEEELARNEKDPGRNTRIIVSSDLRSDAIARGSALIAMGNVGT